MADFGGEMRLSINGVTLKLRGTFTLDPANVTVTTVTNMDNSISRQIKPDAYGCELKAVEDTGVDWQGLLRAQPVPMFIVEDYTGVTHTFARAVFEGAPMIDRETGEVTGLKIRAESYQRKQF
jgi:hypothetical protein